MQTILDLHIRAESQTGYRLELFARDNSQPLATSQFDLPMSFLTGYELSGLEPDDKDPAARVERLKAYGSKLHQKLFTSEDVRRVWEIQKASADFLTLCLRTAPDAVALEALPWEALHDGKEFIAAGLKTGVSRLPLDIVPSAELPAVPLPMRMLALVASPLDLPEVSRLQIEREQEILLEAVNTPAGQGKLFVDFEDEAKLDILEHSLEAGYHIFHFTGHGIPPESGGGLLLEDAAGKQRPTSVSEVIAALQKGAATLRLAVLAGCQTARTLHTGGFNDLARGLARGLQGMPKIPAVLAMQFSITDAGGLMLAEKIYPRLLEGQPLEIALSRTRRDLLLSDDPYLQGDAIAPVLLVSNGRCLQSRAAELLDAPQPIEPDFSFHLPLAQHSFGFYGRRREYRQLRDGLLQRNQRAVIIHGIGGIGKTALVSHVATRLRKRFRGVYAFDCGGRTLAPERVIAELHRYFELQNIHALQRLAYQPLPPEVLATHLAQVLAQWPLLLIFDNFETQLERAGDDFRIADEALRTFLATLVKATATGSRFLFTSRYLFDVDDKRLGKIQSLPLGDLSRNEALMMMQKLPNLAMVTHSEKLAAYQTFGGHPYALVVLDRHCNFRKLSDALADARALHTELREFLAIEINYARLSDDARELLNRLAAFQQGVPYMAAEWVMGEKVFYAVEVLQRLDRGTWSDDVKAMSEADLLAALEQQLPERRQVPDLVRPITELIEWGLLTRQMVVDKLEALFVHNLVRDFCREQQTSETWRSYLRDAAAFYTNLTKLIEEDEKGLEVVRAEMEAFELLMEAEDFADASMLLGKDTPLLARWGYHRQLETQYRRLLGKLDRRGEATVLLDLVNFLLRRNDYDSALEYAQQSLETWQVLKDQAKFSLALYQIGAIHQARNEYNNAIDYFQQSLEIWESLGNEDGVSMSLHQIGMILQRCGEADKALDHFQRALRIARTLNNKPGISGSLHHIGMVYLARGEHDKALSYYQQSLEIDEALGDLAGIATSLAEIGKIYRVRSQYEMALSSFQRAAEIRQSLGDHKNIAESLHEIGLTYQKLDDYETALDYCYRALDIEKSIYNREGVAYALNDIGGIHALSGDNDKAIEHFLKAIEVFEELGPDAAPAGLYFNIGKLLTEFEQYQQAFIMLTEALMKFGKQHSPNVIMVCRMFKTLRGKWGVQEFDTAWQQATGEDVPEWLTQ